MRVTLVFPPNRAIPASPYAGLPMLAGGLVREGHSASIVEANIEVFDRLLHPATVKMAQSMFDEAWNRLRGQATVKPDEARYLQSLAQLAVCPLETFTGIDEVAQGLKDPETFYAPDQANRAYDLISNYLRVMYCMNPVFYQLRDSYNDELHTYLESGFENPIHDIVKNVVIDQILATNPDLVAVTIPFNEQSVEALAILKELKARAPHLKTIVGGAIVSSFHKVMTADARFFRYADFAMPGEADESFPAFVNALANGGDLDRVPNLYWRDDAGKVHAPSSRSLPVLNDIASPDYSSLAYDRYYLPELVVNVQTTRGCYYGKCTFCSDDIKQNFRMREANLVAQDLDKIQQQTGARHVVFWDPLTPPRLMKNISKWNRELPEEKRWYWGAETKFEKLFYDPRFTDMIYDGGARFLQFGYESGSQRVLDLMLKGNDLEKVHLMLEAMRDSKIAVSVQWFIGFPGATEDEDLNSYRYLDKHRDAVVMSSYMGTFSISPEDDISRDKGDMYGIDLFQNEAGTWDYRHRDGTNHYDRRLLHAAYLARGDAESINRMAFFLYLSHEPEKARLISNFERGGALPVTWTDLEEARPTFPDHNFLRTYDFDAFTPPEQQGIGPAGGALPKRTSHAALVTPGQCMVPLSDDDMKAIRLCDGERTAAEVAAALGGSAEVRRARLLELVQRGVLVVPHRVRAGHEAVTA